MVKHLFEKKIIIKNTQNQLLLLANLLLEIYSTNIHLKKKSADLYN